MKLLRALALPLVLVLSGCLSEARGEAPPPRSDWMRYVAVMGSRLGHSETIGTSSTLVRTSTGGATSQYNYAHLFEWDTLVVVECLAEATFCWTQDRAATITVDGWVDSDQDGPGACFRVPANGEKQQRITPELFDGRDLARSRLPPTDSNAWPGSQWGGYCTSTSVDPASHAGKTIGFPCNVAADCPYSGFACTAKPARASHRYIRGGHLVGIADASADCWVQEEI